jgi:CheY-like chemotaxis protein
MMKIEIKARDGDLAGCRVLLIEDEALVMMLLEDTLAELGCEVIGRASWSQEAMEKAESLAFDVAILDVNLNGHQTLDIADRLVERGIPFVFATGYGASSFLARFKTIPILQKPFLHGDLEAALCKARASVSGRPNS